MRISNSQSLRFVDWGTMTITLDKHDLSQLIETGILYNTQDIAEIGRVTIELKCEDVKKV